MGQSLLTKIDFYKEKYINEKISLNHSNNTITTYLSILDPLYEFLVKYEDEIDLKDINKDIFLEFINIDPSLSNSTKQLRVTVLKGFFKYIEQIDDRYSFIKEFSDIKIKKQQKSIESLNDDEVKRLLAIFKKHPTSYNTNRDKLLITILIYTGVRASELLNIKFSDIVSLDEEIFKIKILGKGDKQRYVYISKDKISNELEYLKKYNLTFLASTNTTYKQMTRVGLFAMVKNKMKKANISKQGIHILRHTFAKSLVSKNVNLSTIKELMGHENIATTMIYAKSDEGSMVRAVGLLI